MISKAKYKREVQYETSCHNDVIESALGANWQNQKIMLKFGQLLPPGTSNSLSFAPLKIHTVSRQYSTVHPKYLITTLNNQTFQLLA